MRYPKTRYPFPPEWSPEDVYLNRPIDVPRDTAIAELAGFWLKVECGCGRSSSLPLRLMAATYGWDVPLQSLLDQLRCQRCGSRPRLIIMTDTPAADGLSISRGREVVLVGER